MLKLEDYDPRLKDVNLVFGNIFSSNVYAIGKNKITLIDAGDSGALTMITRALDALNLHVTGITDVIITHSHDDHWLGLTELLPVTPMTVWVSREDLAFFRSEIDRIVGSRAREYSVMGLEDGDVVKTEKHDLVALRTPGHDSGAICLYDAIDKTLFSGDTIFANGTTGSLRSGNLTDMRDTLRRLTEMDIDILLPGHGNLAIKEANDAIRLALRMITWNDFVPEGLQC
jgi:glyoxylase-like metal-dependent hydrolase (beta-lactamase superfamily II)